MRALVYHEPGEVSWQNVPDPQVSEPCDAVVRIDAVSICRADLRIMRGAVAEVDPGRILGHEAVGTVARAGPGVAGLGVGDRVVISAVTACGRCGPCLAGRRGQCLDGGWLLGRRIDGVQAEFVRVPYADTSAHLLPRRVADDTALLLSDLLPTAYEIGVLGGRVEPGASVVVVGCGAFGLAAIATAKLRSPALIVAIDKNPARLESARRLGVDLAVHPSLQCAADVVAAAGGIGADTVIKAVDVPDAFELCTRLVRPGGRIADISAHGRPAMLFPEEDRHVPPMTVAAGLVDAVSIPALLGLAAAGRFDAGAFITHRFDLDEMLKAYELASRPRETGASKVALFRSG
jgi:alcohol dehydrogenase